MRITFDLTLSCLIMVIALIRVQVRLAKNRPFHGLWRHLGWGANTAKITVNVWDFGPHETAVTPLHSR